MTPSSPFIITIDWLQVSVSVTSEFFSLCEAWGYEVMKRERGSKIWRDIYDIKHEGKDFASVACNPYSSALKPDAGVVKFANHLLYREDFITTVYQHLSLMGLRYKGISRLDICCDFQEFNGHYDPHAFVEAYIAGCYHRKGSNKTLIYADCAVPATAPFDLPEGKTVLDAHPPLRFSSLTWGLRTAGVQAQLYCKSLEQAQTRRKPYIIEAWLANGFDLSRPVWRLEFRLSSKSREIRFSGGEVLQTARLNVADLFLPVQRTLLMASLVEKHFCFFEKIGDKVATRRPPVSLLDFTTPAYTKKSSQRVHSSPARSLETTRKTLLSIVRETPNLPDYMDSALNAALSYVTCASGSMAADTSKVTKALESAATSSITAPDEVTLLSARVRYLAPPDFEEFLNVFHTMREDGEARGRPFGVIDMFPDLVASARNTIVDLLLESDYYTFHE